MNMTRPQISVVIPVRNEGSRLAITLRSIAQGRSCLFPLEIVLVDDASDDGCCDSVRTLFNATRDRIALQIIRLGTWSGIPYARNFGAAAATAEILFMTDGNVIFPRNWDLPIRQRLRPGLALCATIADLESSFRGYGCTLLLPSMGVQWLRSPDIYGGYAPIAPCAGTILSTSLFRQVGGYDTTMPVYGAAEPEFSVRLWLSGAKIIVAPQLLLSHRFRPAYEHSSFLADIAQIQVQNYLLFSLLYLDERSFLETVGHYSRRDFASTQTALRALDTKDVWNHRLQLAMDLPRTFEDFERRFHIRCNSTYSAN